jgi:predicted nucleotidyltransferase
LYIKLFKHKNNEIIDMTLPNEIHGIKIPKQKITSYCKKNHIKKLALFGSFLRDDFRSDSDIDVLVEFEKDHIPGFFNLVRMQDQLSQLFHGRKVDLRTPNDLSRYFRDKVIHNTEVLYAES